nr:glutathione S-transferase family protein [Chachezhania sediminis]
MVLHYAPGTIASAVAIALEELGLPYELQQVSFAEAEQTGPAFHALNPKGRVPVLVTARGPLTETGAILEYLAQLAPAGGPEGAALMPADAYDAARVRSVMYYLASTVHVAHAHMRRGTRWATQESSFADMAAKVPQNMADCCAFLEDNVIEGPFVLGETLTLADPYLYVITTWLKADEVDIAEYPKLAVFAAAMEERASVATVRSRNMLSR